MQRSDDATVLMEEREMVITRVFDAPRELVFSAWTEPERLKRWWAPDGASTPFFSVDLRPGGTFVFCLRLPWGDHWVRGVYREVVPPERIVYDSWFADAEGNPVPPAHYGLSAEHPHQTRVAVTFAERDGKTTVTLRQALPASVPERGDTGQGWREMLDRLAAELADA